MGQEKGVFHEDTLVISGRVPVHFILGSGKYSLDLINAAVQNAGAQIITLALRRANGGGTANILDYIPEGVTLLAEHLRCPATPTGRFACASVACVRLRRFSSRSKLCATAKYPACRTIGRPSARPRSLRKGFVVMPYMHAPDLNVCVIWSIPARLPSCRWQLRSVRTKGLATREFIKIFD